MRASGRLVAVKRFVTGRSLRRYTEVDSASPSPMGHPPRAHRLGLVVVLALAVLALSIAAGLALRPGRARGDESGAVAKFLGPGQETAEGLAPTPQQTKEALESPGIRQLEEAPETDTQAASALPHRDLDREEALELAEGVFGAELEAPAGIFDELEPTKFLTNYAAVVPGSSLPEQSGSKGPDYAPEPPHEGSVLLESTLPLRTENSEGEDEAVDLTLQSPEGSGGALQPANPLTEVEVPAQLGEGITLPAQEVGIDIAGAPESLAPSNVEGQYAFFPNVATDTDLAVVPTPTGVETLTDIRSAEAPMTTTYELSLPAGATLESGPQGGAEVVVNGRTTTTTVSTPTATDAAGEPVEATMQVEGDKLAVTVSPGPSTRFPILVDPSYTGEGWNWTYLHESLAAWTGSTTNAAVQPIPYAYWEPAGWYPGLDLSSGGWANGVYGSHADWLYTVPRYNEDISRYGSPPTSYIWQLYEMNVDFLEHGNGSNYPALVVGLADPGSSGWWTVDGVHYGGQGELYTANLGGFVNSTFDTATKAADMNLVTYENEYPAKSRDAYAGEAVVYLIDEDAPRILELTGPSGWVTGSSATLSYSFEDTGLGVRSAGVRIPGEPSFQVGGGVDFACAGTVASPCPRKPVSSESGRPKLTFVPSLMPTGVDELEVEVGDPFWNAGHVASAVVKNVEVDHTPPHISLSGPLTEQESKGTLLSEYPVAITVEDGTDDVPQSGVKSVEVKVDGKKVTMPNETPWHPNCTTRNCKVSQEWTLKASEYAPGNHIFEVIATDALDQTSTRTLEVELGQEPLQTSFTSAHPTYNDGEVSKVTFAATREGKPVEGASFKCGFDTSGKATTPCTVPFEVEKGISGWHTLAVAAVDKSGNVDTTPAIWKFDADAVYPASPAVEKLALPEEGKKTADYFTLEAEWEDKANVPEEEVTGVSFQMKLPGSVIHRNGIEGNTREPEPFQTIPAECTINGQGKQVSWPLRVRSHGGQSSPVYLKVRGCPAFEAAKYPETEIQFRAIFDGGTKVAGASQPVNTEFVRAINANSVATDATETIGPATVDLLSGSFTLNRTDVSIPVPGYEADLEFSRAYSSTTERSQAGYSKMLGGGWQPSMPLEAEAQEEAWTRIEEQVIPKQEEVVGHECWNDEEEEGESWEEEVECSQPHEHEFSWQEEPARPEERWIELFNEEGAGIPFEIVGETFVAPEWANELRLTHGAPGRLILAYPNGTHTIFEQEPERLIWVPREISYQTTPSSMRMVYASTPEGLRLTHEIAPTPVGIAPECGDETSGSQVGCRSLFFEYQAYSFTRNNRTHSESRIMGIWYYGPSGIPSNGQKVAEYIYEGEGDLMLERDPRLPVVINEQYGYSLVGSSPSVARLSTMTPPGQEPWTFSYATTGIGPGAPEHPLEKISRAGATTTIRYGVPVSGAGAPYAMSPEAVAGWGQTDLPVDATAIFPPEHPPVGEPPSNYTAATIDYLDPDGSEVNAASPCPPGVAGPCITTSEANGKGDVVRELGAKARLEALAAPNPPVKSHELDTHSVYNEAGTEMLESWGPLHAVRLESGETVPARQHTTVHYDEGEPTPNAGTPPAYLPTKETVAAIVPGKEGEIEPRVTETRYNWGLRKPEESVVDPGGLKIRTVTVYNAQGQVEETRQPKATAEGKKGTKTLYYSAGATGGCPNVPQYANLPCRVVPEEQPTAAGRPKPLVTKYLEYNYLAEPTEAVESPGGEAVEERKTTTEYDAAGRQVRAKIEGGGTAITKSGTVETLYSPTLGVPTATQFVCEKECTGFDSQATTTIYNTLGQVTKYTDADGNVAETTYDSYGRPVTAKDGKGSRTITYDPTSGVATKLEVSGVGAFTATYDADGDLVERGLPNGLTAKTTYNQADEPTALAYTKTSSCGEKGCTWYEESLERGVDGQIFAGTSTSIVEGTTTATMNNHYKYDKAGRLEEATETPTSGIWTSRSYKYDLDSNRLSKTTRESGVKEPAVQSYEYDSADRLIGPTYDGWGRITKLPAADAGGKELITSYFSSNMVATQEQGVVTNTFQLDASGRQRAREQAGGVAGLEIFHYDGPSDSPAWTELGATWSRNITGIGGELAAVQQSGGTTTFDLTDLHGDVVASASSSPTATKLLASYRSDEFGESESGSPGRFGWLGGSSRRTELQSGVIQMGARSYIPQLGRFLTPDPVPGGSANAYDYADQDPINSFDPGGTKKKKTHSGGGCPGCRKAHKEAQRKFHREVRQVVRTINSDRYVGLLLAKSMGRKEQKNIFESALSDIGNAPSATYHGVASALSALGATVAPVLPSCFEVGAASEAVSVTTGTASIVTAAFPPAEPAAGTLVVISGASGLSGALFDTLGKEGDC